MLYIDIISFKRAADFLRFLLLGIVTVLLNDFFSTAGPMSSSSVISINVEINKKFVTGSSNMRELFLASSPQVDNLSCISWEQFSCCNILKDSFTFLTSKISDFEWYEDINNKYMIIQIIAFCQAQFQSARSVPVEPSLALLSL